MHRWLVVSSFYVSGTVSPMFQQGDIEICKFCRCWVLQIPIFNFFLIQIKSFAKHQKVILACDLIYCPFLVIFFLLLQSFLNNMLVFYFLNDKIDNTLIVVF